MSTITTVPTASLRPGDTVLVDGSVVSVDRVEVDEFSDGYWLYATCISGNFDRWEGTRTRYVDAETQWEVLEDGVLRRDDRHDADPEAPR